MVPEIKSMMVSMFCHFGPYFALLHPENQNLEKMKKKKTNKQTPRDITILEILPRDITPPPNSPNNQNLKKSEKK